MEEKLKMAYDQIKAPEQLKNDIKAQMLQLDNQIKKENYNVPIPIETKKRKAYMEK